MLCPLKHAKIWYVYQDWTLEDVPRCFYCGKGDRARINRVHRNKHHKHVVQKHGIERRVLLCTRDEQFALDEEVCLIAQMRTYVHDSEYNGVGTNYTQGGDGVSGHHDTLEQRQRRSASQTLAWQDPTVRVARTEARNRPETNDKLRTQASASQRVNWQDPVYRTAQCAAIRVAQNKPDTQAKRRASNAQAAQFVWHNKRDKMLSIMQSDAYREKQRLAHLGKPQKCGSCGKTGHNRTTCGKVV